MFSLFKKQTCPPKALDLPAKNPDVVEWEPPIALKIPAIAQAHALVAQFQAEGRTGVVPHHELLRDYPELAWQRGFIGVSERALARALGQVCERVRPYPDKVVSYIIPGPNAHKRRGKQGDVVALRGRIKPEIRDIPWPELPAQAAG